MRIKRHQEAILFLLALLAAISMAACSSTVKLPKRAGDATPMPPDTTGWPRILPFF